MGVQQGGQQAGQAGAGTDDWILADGIQGPGAVATEGSRDKSVESTKLRRHDVQATDMREDAEAIRVGKQEGMEGRGYLRHNKRQQTE